VTGVAWSDLSPGARDQALAKLAAEDLSRPASRGKTVGGSDLERALLKAIRFAGLPEPSTEVVFAPPRKWRWDLAWVDERLACEVEGGVYSGGRHVRGKGFEEDARKYTIGVILGWRVIRVTTSMVESGEALAFIAAALEKGP
jgi:very-short-patch-repair endonuclease